MERARRFYIRLRQSFYGLGAQRRNKGWHLTLKNSRSHVSEVVSKWVNGIEKLLPVVDRLRYIQIECRDFRELFPLIDDKTTFFYCDPPYPKESRSSHNDYMYDFSRKDHKDLAEILHSIKGKVMISGYECKTMNTFYSDFNVINLGAYSTISGKKGKECIWMNYKVDHLGQMKLFE
jgi:DNA adenine methylase